MCVTYYTDLLYFLLKGIIFNLIACSEDHNRIPVQLSTHAQVTEKHDGPKTVLKVSYSTLIFGSFKHATLFMLVLKPPYVPQGQGIQKEDSAAIQWIGFWETSFVIHWIENN